MRKSTEEPRLVLLPGLGADRRLFHRQQLPGVQVELLDWIEPIRGESLREYAVRLAKTFDTTRPMYLGGVSMGGMVALELARLLTPVATFLIASARSPQAIPRWYHLPHLMLEHLPLAQMRTVALETPFVRWSMGPMDGETENLVCKMVADTSPRFIGWAIRAVLGWDGPGSVTGRVFQIHGGEDRLLPANLQRPDVLVPSAGHLVNLTHPQIVNEFLLSRLIHEPEL